LVGLLGQKGSVLPSDFRLVDYSEEVETALVMHHRRFLNNIK
jgi:hypothetical protein